MGVAEVCSEEEPRPSAWTGGAGHGRAGCSWAWKSPGRHWKGLGCVTGDHPVPLCFCDLEAQGRGHCCSAHLDLRLLLSPEPSWTISVTGNFMVGAESIFLGCKVFF